MHKVHQVLPPSTYAPPNHGRNRRAKRVLAITGAGTETRDSSKHEFDMETQTIDGGGTSPRVIPSKNRINMGRSWPGPRDRPSEGHIVQRKLAQTREKEETAKTQNGARERDPPLPSVRFSRTGATGRGPDDLAFFGQRLAGGTPIRPTPSQTRKETTEKANRTGHEDRLLTWHLSLFLPFPSCWCLERVSGKRLVCLMVQLLTAWPSTPHLPCTGTSPRRRLTSAHSPSLDHPLQAPPTPGPSSRVRAKSTEPSVPSKHPCSLHQGGKKAKRGPCGDRKGPRTSSHGDLSEDWKRTRGFVKSSVAVNMRDACPASLFPFSPRGVFSKSSQA